jgi:Heparinase II/III-like protein
VELVPAGCRVPGSAAAIMAGMRLLGSRGVIGCAVAVLVLSALAGCTSGSSVHHSAPSAHAPVRIKVVKARHAKPLSADARACGSMETFPAGTAAQIMTGSLTISPFRTAAIDPGRDGDIDWSTDPYDNPTWVLYFQWGEWIEALIQAYLKGGPHADAYRDRAEAILKTWIADVPIADKNPLTAICSAQAFPGQAWIHDQIPVLLDYYAANWQGAYNHGLSQDLELLQAGCAYPAREWGGKPLQWRDEARQQLIDSFEPNQYGPAVDSQGAVNEQATGYENFDLGLWTEAEDELASCGLSLPGWITSRIAQIPTFLAMATMPDGRLVQIGDTYNITPRDRVGTPLQYAATEGKAGSAPKQRIAVYAAGYVFGRSAWGTSQTFGQQSFYSLRFGPGTQIHGHADHMGLTYYARGRNLIVNSGHYGYQQTAYRSYLLSPEAASVLVMPGVSFNPSAPTALISKRITAAGQFYEFYDTAFGGLPRYRSVYVSQDPDFILVFDRASGAGSYQQLWHLDPALSVRTVTSSSVIATAPGTQLEIRQVPLPGQVIPAGSTQVVRGQVNPYQGWVSRASTQMIAAPVVIMNQTGSSAAMLTLIAPTAPHAVVTAATSRGPGSTYRLRVDIAGRQLTFAVTASGDITQIR